MTTAIHNPKNERIRKRMNMKTLKSKDRLKLVLALSATVVVHAAARAEVGLGEIWGTAWTIGNVIVGETTLTPAYAVEYWYYYFREQSSSYTKRVTRSRITGEYFYYSKFQSGSTVFESTEPFLLNGVRVLNVNCSWDSGNGQIGTSSNVEIHKEWVWMAKVEQTGLWPDNGPWTVWLKTSGQKNVSGCRTVNPVGTYFWNSASIGKTGGQSITLGTPNCTLDYPFYLANDFYK